MARRIRGLVAVAATAAAVISMLASARPIEAQGTAVRPRPKLVVLLVVDQLRADYIDRYGAQWNAGLKRLVDQGAWFRLAAYPYLNTVTCPGHATISTGAFPQSHGISLNEWWGRAEGRLIPCTEDARSPLVSYGRPVNGGDSPAALRLPTLADELRAQLPVAPRIVTMSLKARTAVMLAGRRAEASTWFDDEGEWVTSSAYTSTPVAWVQRVIDRNPMARELEAVWTRTLAPEAYLFPDAGTGERPPPGWTASFPHPLAPPDPSATGAARFERWDRSPYADDYLGRIAGAAVDELKLGSGPGVDYLAVSFSALDRVGHRFGPRSHEVQDTLVRLDRTIGRLLAHLDRTVGRANYVVALTSDHGVAPIAEQAQEQGLSAGRISTAKTADAVNAALQPFLGPGRHVARMVYTDLYFAPGVYAQLQAKPEALRAAFDALLATEGVWRVYRKEDLIGGLETSDPTRRAATLSFVEDRSGDLIVVPRPYYYTSSDATTHGTAHQYDARVPVILAGQGIRRGEYLTAATPADIAPTLAFLAGITMSAAEGRVLTEALAPPTPQKPPASAAPRR
jgi:predicted AlkP superfamily pyrophosphatase or phosphodiesterase